MANHAKAVFLDTEPAQFQIDEEALRACVKMCIRDSVDASAITMTLTAFGCSGLLGSWLFGRLFDGHRFSFLDVYKRQERHG